MDLVIAEKDLLARDIARAVCGAPDGCRLPYRGGGMVVCAASGHLLELMEPADVDPSLAEWREDTLPIALHGWPKSPRDGRSADKLEAICELVDECDGCIYHAGDADDEGQLIVDEILEWAHVDPADARVKRVYVTDSIDKNIRTAFEEARPNAACVADGLAAQARSLADMSFGVTESRLATIRLGVTTHIGRVQTPTLGLVVERDLARANHEERMHYALAVDVTIEDGSTVRFIYKPEADALEDGKRCFDDDLLESVLSKAEGADVSFAADRKEKAVQPPLPYNMTTLAADMSKRFKMTAERVMEATQSLRDEHRAITYNRASSSHLPESMHADSPGRTGKAAANIGCAWPIDTSIKSPAFDDSKVEAHHGIVPQEIDVDVSKLSKDEERVYRAICERYLAQFLSPARVAETKASFGIEGIPGSFAHSSKEVMEAGWQAHLKPAKDKVGEEDGEEPSFCPAGAHEGRVEGGAVKAKKTTPPKPFTDGSLMQAMANVARYVKDPEVKRVLLEKDSGSADEHGSIGTVATRASIIEGLIQHGYLVRDERGGTLSATEKALSFFRMIPEAIRGVDLTARWWLMQQKVAAGELDPEAIMADVAREFESHKSSAYEGQTLLPVAGACPRCGADVVGRGKTWSCSSNVERKDDEEGWCLDAGCGFKLLPVCGHALTRKQAAALLSGKAVPLKGLVSKKTGKKFDATAHLGADGVELSFPKKPAAKRAGAGSRSGAGRSRRPSSRSR